MPDLWLTCDHFVGKVSAALELKLLVGEF